MLLVLLRDGSHIEVSQAADVIHKLGFIVCVDHLDTPVVTFSADEVLAYTRNDKLAEEFVAAKDDIDDMDVLARRQPVRRRSRRFKEPSELTPQPEDPASSDAGGRQHSSLVN